MGFKPSFNAFQTYMVEEIVICCLILGNIRICSNRSLEIGDCIEVQLVWIEISRQQHDWKRAGRRGPIVQAE